MRLLGIVIIAIGALYAMVGFIGLAMFRDIHNALRLLGTDPTHFPGTEALETSLFVRFFLLGLTGIASIFAGVGLIKRREWARRLWLAISSVASALQLYDVAARLTQGSNEHANLSYHLFWLILAGGSWFYLTRPSVRQACDT